MVKYIKVDLYEFPNEDGNYTNNGIYVSLLSSSSEDIINTTITAGGSDICIMGVVIAVSTITTLEQEKEKGQRNKYIDREIPIYRIRLMNNINKLST